MTQLSLLDLLDTWHIRPPMPKAPATAAPPLPTPKPCPFCASAAIFWAKTRESEYLYCEGCGAEMHRVGPKARHYAALRWITRGEA